jgi:predicted lipoprotein with Yx(FWY)xxD motif
MQRKIILSGAAFIGFAVVSAQAAERVPNVEIATPPGITLQPLDKGQGYDLGKSAASFIARERIAFTDEKGLTLYTYANDTAGKVTCLDECAKSWLPALVSAKAKAFGPWSIIARPDGAKQWAYQGKALYRFVNDVDPGSVGGNSPMRFGSRRMNGAGILVGGGIRGAGVAGVAKDVPLPAEWTPALAFPVPGVKAPEGLGVREVPDAAVVALVDSDNFTLYTTSGTPSKEEGQNWKPVQAPIFAKASGDFGFIERTDGIRQWSYKGRGLYSFAGDLVPGDANGVGVAKAWDVAAVTRFYMPDGVAIRATPGQGKVLANAQGMTLYRRDGHILQSGGGHNLRRGAPPRPAVGRDIGTDPRCNTECLKDWAPFLASADAEPQGFWSVAMRADGTKQWVYQGYALWTYAGDKAPGDINGHDTYQIMFSEDKTAPALDVGTPYDGAPGLYWAIAIP